MAVPKNLPNREIWAKEAVNSLPPLASPPPAPEPEAPVVSAAQETPPARTQIHRGTLSRGTAADEQRKPPSQRK